MADTTATKPLVLVADPISEDGQRVLEADYALASGDGASLKGALSEAVALVVRSRTQVTEELLDAAPRLRVVGRAGIGTDNIDVEAASRRGIVVVNAPTAVVVAAAEHTVALLLALLRHVPRAHQSVTAGRWERSAFLGTELRGKSVGIVGLGNIGAEVARRLAPFEVRLLGSDPFARPEIAARLGIELLSLDALLQRADVMTLHVPLNAATRNLIGTRELARMRPGSRLVNCSRGGVLDEGALVAALERGHLAGAALDVFAEEPPTNAALLASERVVLTPHLGASTEEAQSAAAVEVAGQVAAVLRGEPVPHAVNAPPGLYASLTALEPYAKLGEKLGRLLGQLGDGETRHLEIAYHGEIARADVVAIRASILTGLLRSATLEQVNVVNAHLFARNRGLEVSESRSATPEDNYANLVVVRAASADGFARELAGTAIDGEPHLVRVDEHRIDVDLAGGYLLFVRNIDRPGVVGKIGTLLGDGDVNISAMQVGRTQPRGHALMVLAVDEPVPSELLARLVVDSPIQAARLAQL